MANYISAAIVHHAGIAAWAGRRFNSDRCWEVSYLYIFTNPSSSGLGIAILLGISMPGLVGALAAIYPARLAAMVRPAEAVRY